MAPGRRVGISGGKCDTCGHTVALTDRLGGHRRTPSGSRRRCTYEPQVSHLAVQQSAGPSGQEASPGRCPTCGHVSRSGLSQWEHLHDREEKCDPPQLELIRLFKRPAGMSEILPLFWRKLLKHSFNQTKIQQAKMTHNLGGVCLSIIEDLKKAIVKIFLKSK